ncbi:ferric iron uptake transcriptional regulator [Wenzhouxiangella marina]|uniref:Ferric uptake regulation protein n=1 Tax=Wenzhouxiangella marina TaxID=1579979 RepID=A0A0K0XX04_9GAMM|nr:ferric iron uptake transcriptional regulator [Wenzhouxiangella marina]AKS42203.1 Ferric uptake regulator, Fur family [Wenzhouxiangella marina]MBB6086025.1 Fur family ferric uptake transcriptional regulator [Wenzhouxiangella marina]
MPEERSELRKAGLKVTHPRLQILKLLEETPQKHMTADEIYRSLMSGGEEIGLATVYRVLNQFESAGLVRKHLFTDAGGTSTQACYELDEGGHHDHMVCEDTGKVIEFYDEQIEKRQEEIAREHGYEIVNHSLVMYVRPIKKA